MFNTVYRYFMCQMLAFIFLTDVHQMVMIISKLHSYARIHSSIVDHLWCCYNHLNAGTLIIKVVQQYLYDWHTLQVQYNYRTSNKLSYMKQSKALLFLRHWPLQRWLFRIRLLQREDINGYINYWCWQNNTINCQIHYYRFSVGL